MIGPALLLLLAGPAVRPPEPYKAADQRPLEFPGPGRDAAEPDVSEVVLGWFGPGDPDHPDFGTLWRGATLALEEENAAGGDRGKPFRLVPAWSESPWQAGVGELARLVHDRGAWAVIGGVDGATTHLAEQLALKAYVPLLSPGSTDATADQANVPWLFSLPPSDERLAPLLARSIAEAAASGPFVIAVSTDHDSRAALVRLRRELGTRRLLPSALVELAPGAGLPDAVDRLLRPAPKAVVVLAPSSLAGRLVAAVRTAGFAGAVVGGPTLAQSAFARAAGAAAEGVWAPQWLDAGRPACAAFTDAYGRRWAETPDAAAVHGYDAVRIAAAAVRRAGLNRVRIRDAVRTLAPWTGACGCVRWDARGRNEAEAWLSRWIGGRLRAIEPGTPGPRPSR